VCERRVGGNGAVKQSCEVQTDILLRVRPVAVTDLGKHLAVGSQGRSNDSKIWTSQAEHPRMRLVVGQFFRYFIQGYIHAPTVNSRCGQAIKMTLK